MHPTGIAQIFLDRLLSRSRLSESEQRAVLELSWTQGRTEAHADVVRRGAEVTSCCLVVEGLIARTGHTAEGERQITAFYLPGDMPDLHSLMTPDATATLHAISNSSIVRVPRADLRDAFLRFPGIAQALWRETVTDANIASEWLVNIGRRPARQRLAHLLCEMAERSSTEEPAEHFDFSFPVTQIHLAEATGVSSVHINRVLQELRKERLMDMRDHRVMVHDWAGLQEEAGFDPAYLSLCRPARLAPVPG